MRFWIDRSCLKGQEFLIKDSLYHHICRVCKFKKGDVFELLCEGQQKYKVVLTALSHVSAGAKILETYPVPPLKKPYLHLALSLPRLTKMDFLIEKSVELGVKEIHPFISTFSFLKKRDQISSARKNRWKKIIKQSLALSGRTESLKIHPCCFLQDIEPPPKDIALMAYEGDKKQVPLAQLLKKQVAPTLWLFVGSEGGFSPQEAQDFSLKNNHFVFSMGDQILRVETACLFGLSVLKYHYHL